MPEMLKKISNQITTMWQDLSKKKKILFISLLIFVVVISILCVSLLNRTEYVVLYTGLDRAESAEIYNKLKEKEFNVKAENDGTILVPEEHESNIRMELAAEGYPKSGLNYDIFKNSTGFGTTEYEKQKYMQFQLQDRLQDTIKTIDVIEEAIVTLTIPDNGSVVLKEDKRPATASVLLKIKNNKKLSEGQVDAIVELVSKSVPGLSEDNVSIIDHNMTILNRSNSGTSSAINVNSQIELETKVCERLEKQILNLLEPVFGYGQVVTGVNVKLDFDTKTTESIRFEPVLDDEGIAVSLTELEEISRSRDDTGGVPGQDENGGAPRYVEGNEEYIDYQKVSRTVNYEVNETRELINKAQGQIKELSVSVVIDANVATDEVISQVQELVAGTVGIDSELVVVKSMEFTGREEIEDVFNSAKEARALAERQLRNRNIALFSFLAILLLIIIIVAIRLVIPKRQVESIDYVVNDEDLEGTEYAEEVEDFIPEIIINKDKNSYKEQISKFYNKYPDIVVQIVRNWLNED